MRRAAIILVLSALLLTGCSPKAPEFVDKGTTYTQDTLRSRLASASAQSLAARTVAEAPELRSRTLAALRGKGDAASAAATLITKSFPAETASVPVYVERATFEGKQALVIVEAYGASGGKLDRKRLWVIDDKGTILFSAASR